jgi:hypothetical protein
MIDISMRVSRWEAHFNLHRSGEDAMDWKARAAKRRADREAHAAILKKQEDGRPLLVFLFMGCFHGIIQRILEEAGKCGHPFTYKYDSYSHTFALEKEKYPSAKMTLVFVAPSLNGTASVPFTCTTTGLGVDNVECSTTARYRIKVEDGGIVYRKIDEATGRVADATFVLDDLVDDILLPFADCIAP